MAALAYVVQDEYDKLYAQAGDIQAAVTLAGALFTAGLGRSGSGLVVRSTDTGEIVANIGMEVAVAEPQEGRDALQE